MPNQTTPLSVKIVKPDGKELFWPHAHVPRVGEVISMKTGDNHTVKSVTYNLVDAVHAFDAIVSVT